MVPRKAWLALSAVGVLVAVLTALLPVRVHFAGDPLLRLRDLDPELSPPVATADCGSPRHARNATARGTSLYELARASACRDAGQRRLAVALAAGAALVVLGLVGAASISRGGLRPPPGRPGRGPRPARPAGPDGPVLPSTDPTAPVPSG